MTPETTHSFVLDKNRILEYCNDHGCREEELVYAFSKLLKETENVGGVSYSAEKYKGSPEKIDIIGDEEPVNDLFTLIHKIAL